MFLLERFKVFLKIFYWTGLAPFPTLSRKQQCYHYMISVLVSSVINIGSVAVPIYFPLYKMYGSIEKIVNYAYVGSLTLSNLSANLQCYHYKSVHSKIINQVIKIENNFKTRFPEKHPFRKVAYRYKLIVLIITVLLLTSFALQFCELWHQYDHKVLIMVSFNVLTQLMSALILFHVLLHISIVQMFIAELNLRIKKDPICFYSKAKIEFLKTIKLMHMDVWKLQMQINNFFSWNLPFLIIHLVIQATYNFYWIFLILQVEWNLLYIVRKISFQIIEWFVR